MNIVIYSMQQNLYKAFPLLKEKTKKKIPHKMVANGRSEI
jgi:hypothetical protein